MNNPKEYSRQTNLLADIRLRWYDDNSLMLEDRELLEIFLDSLGVSREVAVDIFEVLLEARSQDIGLRTGEIKNRIIQLRRKRNKEDVNKGLTDRNIQIWLKFFREIELVERFKHRYRFTKNKSPSRAFKEHTQPEVIEKASGYIHRLLKEIEKRHGIRENK